MRRFAGRFRGRSRVVALACLALACALAASAPATVGVFSLDRLRLQDASGAEDYVFTAGDVIYPDGGVDPGTFYRIVVKDAGNVVRNAPLACVPAESFTTTDNTYRVNAADPPSTTATWKLTIEQYATSACSGTPAKTATKNFNVARVDLYSDTALTKPATAVAPGGVAYVTVSGMPRSVNDWSVTWLRPDGGVSCANTAGTDRPDANSDGRLPPKTNGGYLQYRPDTANVGSVWNRESKYETGPCADLASSSEGTWKLRLESGATSFVTLAAFALDGTAPPAPSIDSKPPAATSSTSASLGFSDSESGVSFVCRLDGAALAPCTSPQSYSGLGSGNHTFEVRARDSVGNESAGATYAWTVDATAPTVTLTRPASGDVVASSTPSFAGSAGTAPGDSSVVLVDVYAGSSASGTPVQTVSGGGAGGTWSASATSPLPDGTYTAQAQQADAAGNVGRSNPTTFSVSAPGPDATPPNVTLTAPADGATVNTATPAFAGGAGTAPGDQPSVTVDVYAGSAVTGSPVQTLTATAAGGAWSVTASDALADGTYTARAQQSDDAGNTGSSGTSTFAVDTTAADTTPPVITLTAPANGATLGTASPSFSGVAGTETGDEPLVVVEVYAGASASGSPVQSLSTTAGAGGSYTVGASGVLADGTYTAQAEQSDEAGNTGRSGASTFAISTAAPDATPPAVTLTAPANGSTVTTATPSFSGAAGTDPGDQATVTVKVYPGSSASGNPVQTLSTTASGGSWSVTASSPLADGIYTAQAEQSDQAANKGRSAASTFTVDTVVPDTTPPAVTLTAPANGSTVATATPSFSGAAGTDPGDQEAVTVKVYAGSSASGSPAQTLSATAGGGSWSVTASAALADGTYTAQAEQSDQAGNTGRSGASTFTVSTVAPDTTPPAVTLTAPANGSTVNVSTPAFAGAAGTAPGDLAAVTVKLYAGSTASGSPVQTLSATASGGSWSATASAPLADGTYTAQAEQSDQAANTGRSSPSMFTIDTTATDTTPPVITLRTPADGGTTTDPTPTFSGVAGTLAGDSTTVTVELFGGSSATGTPLQTLTTTRGATGAYSVDAPSPLVGGTYTAQATQSDAAGNLGTSESHSFLVNAGYADEVLADSPSLYWRLAETSGTTARDETGANDGTYKNGVLLGQPGALPTTSNTAASFDAVDDMLTAADASSLDATTAVSMEVWIKRTRAGVWQNVIGKSGGGAVAVQNYALWINTTNNVVGFFGDGTSSARVDGPVLDTSWHHVVATFDNATAKIYVDGTLRASTTSTIRMAANANTLNVGRGADGSRAFGGSLDEVAIYRSVLSATRIQAHYDKATTFDQTPPSITLTAPVDGATINDTSPTFTGVAGTAAGDSTTVTVRVYAGTAATGTPLQTLTTTRGADGSYSAPTASALAEGTYTAQAEQSDQAGNVGRSGANTFTVTSADVTAPVVTLTSPADGASTVDTTPTISGTAGVAPGDLPTITVKIWTGLAPGGTPLQTLTATASGAAWSVEAATLPEGVYAVRAEQSDVADNIGLSAPHSFTVGTGYADVVLADTPSLYWRLGEGSGTTAADQTGANNGTYKNGVLLGQAGALTGEANAAAAFDGVDDVVTAADANSLDATTAVTIEAWIRRSKAGVWQNVIGKDGGNAVALQNYALWINTTNNVVAFFGNGTASARVDGPVLDTSWHHVVATYDNTTAKMYVDGALKASASSSVRMAANASTLNVGRGADGSRPFGGLIDEVAIYRSVLSATRVALHYQKGNAVDTVAPVVTLSTPVDGSTTLNAIPHFAGEAATTASDAPTVSVKVYSGSSATGTPLQTLSAAWTVNGPWSVDASSPLPLGTYTARAEQTDAAGNVGRTAANTFSVVVRSATTDPQLAGAGDIADCTDSGVTATSNLILGLPASTTIQTLGDNAYPKGSASDFASCYDPTWGRFKTRTHPAIGDHEYETPNASGYFGYFQDQLAPNGPSASDPNRAYYSYDLGTWHVVVLNGACAEAPACSASAQASWLDSDLSANQSLCTLAILDAPRWSSGSVHGSNATMSQYFTILYQDGADLLLSGDDHLYERFALQDPQGFYDPARGVRQLIAGTGGGSLYTFGTIRRNSEVRRSGNYGIFRLTLHPGSYEWEFVPTSGSFSDSGSTACH